MAKEVILVKKQLNNVKKNLKCISVAEPKLKIIYFRHRLRLQLQLQPYIATYNKLVYNSSNIKNMSQWR